jgi:hypothetical protein
MLVHAFVSLKQPDLHAISALASLKALLGEAAPKQLFRCRHLLFATDSDIPLSADVLAPALASRFDIVNPNKEQIGWDQPPAATLSAEYALFWVDVLSRDEGPAARVTLAGVPVDKRSRVTWGIVVPSRGLSRDNLQTQVAETLLFGKAPGAGLLVNPVLETAQFF